MLKVNVFIWNCTTHPSFNGAYAFTLVEQINTAVYISAAIKYNVYYRWQLKRNPVNAYVPALKRVSSSTQAL